MNEYNYADGIEFEPLMPEVMKASGVETIGGSSTSVEFFGKDANGCDQMEIIDNEAFYK